MSRQADMMGVLPHMLNKFGEESHQAIIETFSEMLSDGWSDSTVEEMFATGIGFSDIADTAIKNELQCWGIGI